MSDQTFDLLYADLEHELAELGQRLEWTPTPDLAPMILAPLTEPTPLPHTHRRRNWLVAAALIALLIGGVMAGSSSVRTSVADFLGIDGLRIEFGEPDTTPSTRTGLGTPTSMADLRRWLPFTPMQPAFLGEPDAVYLRILENGDVLGMMTWAADDTLPETAETGHGALLMQFDLPEETVMLLKTVGLTTGTITETTIDGEDAWWVAGASELTIFGDQSTDTRLTGNVLIWQQDGIGFRLESALSMDEAITIAESLEPAASSS